jgi:pimeloyl-ACP methyl ester carboxylesterase
VVAVHRIWLPLLLSVLLAAPATAHAAAGFSPGAKCDGSNFECTRVSVPLDRSGAIPGKIPLYVERTGSKGHAVFALAGGPGQGNSTVTESFNRDLPLPEDHYMVVFDQRGTGKSKALNCPELERETKRPIDVRAADCAKRLGPRRALYTTRDSVEDLEAVRQRIGDDRITLYGVSYGTKVAVAYALAYPQHVERLILDSVVEPEGQSPFDLTTYAALPRVLGEICRGECAQATPDLAADVRALAAELRAAPLKGPFFDRRGRRRTVSVSARDLYGTLRQGDLNPGVRAEYPSAVRSALDGDPGPLLRLEHRFDSLPDIPVPPDSAETLSFSLFTATLCEEAPLPWERTAAFDDRIRQASDRAAAIPDDAFLPFDRQTALALDSNSLLLQCRLWPAAAEAPALAPGPLPDVPVLVLEGEEDLRTPVEAGRRVAERFPQATVVTVPKTAHAVLGQPGAKCAKTAVRRWFAGKPVSAAVCAAATRKLRVRPVIPASLSAVPGRGAPERTLAATLLTLTDLYREQGEIAFLLDRPGGGGLRGGHWSTSGRELVLKRLSLVPGVKVSGRVGNGRHPAGTLTVSGKAAARGRLTLTSRGVLSGRLGGKQVRGRFTHPAVSAAKRSSTNAPKRSSTNLSGAVEKEENPCLTAQAKKLLCPTLTISPPSSMYFERRSSGRLVLRATSSLNSVGAGPIELRGRRTGPNTMSATQRIYKRRGGHINLRTGARLGFKSIPGQYRYWKLLNAARFELWTVDSRGQSVKRVRTGPKLYYCLRDLQRTRVLPGSPPTRHYPACSQDLRRQRLTLGTSVGWSDIYPATYHEQWIDVTGLHGRYRFVMIADPTDVLYTTNDGKPIQASRIVKLP